jgi:hypothetical protein
MKRLAGWALSLSAVLLPLSGEAQITFRGASSSTALSPQFRSANSATLPTPTFRAATSAATTGVTLTIARPAGTVTDDVMIAAIGIRPTTATVAPPAGWILVRRLDNGSPNANSLVVYRKVATGAEPASYAFGIGGSTHTTGGIQSFFNVDSTNPIDVENGQNTANGLNHATPSVTTTVRNAMVVTAHSYASASSWTAPAGMTESYDVASAPPTAVGQTTEGARVLQAARGATGAKTATAAGDADVGNAHILALKSGLRIARPAGLAANDVMIASIGVTPSTAVVTAPAGWTLVRRIDNAAITSNSLLVFSKSATGAEPANYEWSVSGVDFAVGGIQAFFNVDTAAPIDVEAGQCTPQPICALPTNSHSTPSVTATVPNTLVVTSHTYASSRSWTPPAGTTEAFDRPSGGNSPTGQSVEGNYVFQSAAGATGVMTANSSGGGANNDVGNAHILALRSPRPVLTINVPAGTVANDVMIAAVAVQPSTTVVTPPAGWTLIRQINNGVATTNSLYIYRRVAGGSEPASYTWTPAGLAYAAGGIQSFAGVDTTTPIDVENGAATVSALTHATPSVVTTVANTMVVTFHTMASSATWVSPAGMTEALDDSALTAPDANGQSIEGNHIAQAAIGATGVKTATASASADRGNAHILALRPAAGVPAPGSFNAFETGTAAGAIVGVIRTKVAGAAFSLDVVAVASGAQLSGFTAPVIVELLGNNTLGVALDAANCPTSFTTVQTVSPNPTITGGRSTVSFAAVPDSWRDVRVRVRWPTASPTVTACSTDNFAIRPNALASFAVSDDDWQTAGTTRLLDSTTFGATLHKAGRPFSVRASAVNAAGAPAVTTNYVGTPAASLSACAGAACTASFGSLALNTAFGAGQLVSDVAAYDNVGSFQLQLVDSSFASVDASDGSPADCTAAGRYVCSAVINAGRFVPDHFAVSLNAPAFGTACGTGNFSYVGQVFSYTIVPVITITAQDFTNATTTLYAGSWFRVTNSSLTGRAYSDATGILDSSGVPGTAIDPAILATGGGSGTLTFSSGTGLFMARNTPVSPFAAEISLAINVIDADGVAYAANPARFGQASAGNGVAFDAGKEMRFGRLRLHNAAGTSLLDLPLGVEVQYYNGVGFARNVADSCTSIPVGAVGLANFTPNLAACETALQPGAGNLTFTSGRVTNLVLRKPGNGNEGSVGFNVNLGASASAPFTSTCTTQGGATVPAGAANLPFLRGDWGSGSYGEDPLARAAFGIYRNAEEFIYFRENY